MRRDRSTRILLGVIAVLLFLNLISGVYGLRPAQAVAETNGRGKYQISSWACAIGTYGHHKGYYVLDTTTGKVVDSRDETHEITSDIQKETQKMAPKGRLD